MTFTLGVVIGLFIGATLGAVAMAMMAIARDADDRELRSRRR